MSIESGIYGSMVGMSGIVAQFVAPIPDDLKTWPVTAMLVLLVLVCLGIIAGQTYAAVRSAATAAKAYIENAQAITALAAEERAGCETMKEVVLEMRDTNKAVARLCTTLDARPCARG